MKTRTLVIVAVAAALSTALSVLRVFEMPQGGSVTLDTLPVFYVAFWQGPLIGIAAGALSGLIQLLLVRPFAIHPVQVLLDYPLAMAACGLAGFFRWVESERLLKTGIALVIGVVLVAAAGLQWLELSRISDTSEVVLARGGGYQTILTVRPDSTFGDVEGRIVTVRARNGEGPDTVSIISGHGDTARRWLYEAMATTSVRQVQWLGMTLLLFASLGGVALLARNLSVGMVGLGVLTASAAKFGLHVLSGVVFFAAYAPVGENVWVYSAAYNAAYLIPQTIFALVLLPPLLKRAGTAATG